MTSALFRSISFCCIFLLYTHRGGASNSTDVTAQGQSCRLVVLTSKGATVCLVRDARCAPGARPASSGLGPPPSPGDLDRRSPLPPSPSSSTSLAGERAGHLGGQGRRSLTGSHPRRSLGAGAVDVVPAAVGSVAGDPHPQQLAVFLRRSCRFNSDLVLASITRYSVHTACLQPRLPVLGSCGLTTVPALPT